MMIHVVRPGDTIYSVARAYGVSPAGIINATLPPDPGHLVVGQTLLIPTPPPANLPAAHINAYIEPRGTEADAAMVREVAAGLTYVAVFSYEVKADGSFKAPKDDIVVREARRLGVAPLLTITNFEAGKFSSEIARAVIRDQAVQRRVIDQLMNLMRTKQYRGVNVDFEYLFPEDRESYNQFLRNLVARARPEGFLVSTALAPKTSAAQKGLLYEAHDYAAHGQIVDFSILMTYEYGWSGGPPMAVAPPFQIRKVLQFAVSVMPRNKIMMGLPLYGYDWTLPYVKGGRWAKRVSPQQAYTLAYQRHAAVQYDIRQQSPFFNYWVDGTQHVVWFEDARSMQQKFNLMKEFGLRGGSYWVLGSSFPQNWSLLRNTFRIVKI
ncbi:glycosyl hydrolase family 18 protein [Paenibacillus chartarius]|uniref:Glycosyl hydrolase family 18 protein n=1 Tax=Paenibacillus chartarius TaxID=747481 RepID=A0ABV6DHR8_9BACL